VSKKALSRNAKSIQEFLTAAGVDARVMELPSSTHTAKQAAAAIGCSIGQIAKSLVFRTVPGMEPVLVVAGGANRVNEDKIRAVIGQAVEMADPAFVRRATGFAVGGVPPFGHASAITTILDRDLMQWDVLWASAGTPHAMVRLRPGELQRLTGGGVHAIT
jgi:prolyl-tRNA editing enzyme YbaK/EbsC (Cys-tRNA(Pro) deacylase)